jgi:hypothetical protein
MKGKSLVDAACAVILTLIVANTGRADLSTGLVAYYPFNGNANDASGNGHDGNVHGASLTSDRFGTADSAYSFNGVSDYISVPFSDAFQSSEFTLVAWIRIGAGLPLASTSVAIMARGEDSSTDRLWSSLEIAGSTAPWATGAGTLLIYEDDSDIEHVYETFAFPDPDTWTQIAVTRSSSGEILVYLDGDVVGHWFGTEDPTTTCTQELTIGARWWSAGTSGPYELEGYFPGSIDDVIVYNRFLSADEINQLPVVVPIPGAALLGILGLSIAGWRVRRLKT